MPEEPIVPGDAEPRATSSPGGARSPGTAEDLPVDAEDLPVDAEDLDDAGRLWDALEQSRRLAWQVAVDAAGVGTFDWDVTNGTLVWDERFGVLFGYDEVEGLRPGTADFPTRVHPDDLARVNATIARAIEECGEYGAEYRVVHPDGQVLWVAARGRVLADQDGRPVRMLGAVYDITPARAAQQQAERAAWRAGLLDQVTVELTETLDADDAVARLAGLLVPDLADWCIISLVPDDLPAAGPSTAYRLRDVGWAHADPAAEPLLRQYLPARMAALTDDNPVARALRTGQPSHLPAGAVEVLQAALASDPARDLIGRLAPASALIVPLRARGRTLGLISLYNGTERGTLRADDVELMRDIAVRAGLALDNTRLYHQQRHLAEHLQRAMLTDPPAVEHLRFAVRYVPAGQAAQVGGDWYDAVVHPDGGVTVVIGDVVGHDVAAAAAMGQLRSMLRAIAAHSGQGPADVLHGLDTVMHRLRMPLTATAVVARIDRTPGQGDPGAALHWSNAGHPPPTLIHADGTVTCLTTADPDLLLGLDPAVPRTQTTLPLPPGTTLLLYSDGLVERRDQPLDEGLDLLQQVLTGLPGSAASLDDLCDHLLERMLPATPQDDIALIAVRTAP